MKIKKVKATKENKIFINYEQRSKDPTKWDEFQFTCSEEARPEFYTALEDLAEFVIEMCELPVTYQERIKVRGVSFSYGGDADVMGATISAAMKLYDSYNDLNINTPHKAECMYNENTPNDDMQLLSYECVEALNKLKIECEAYIKGDRAQGTLFDVA